ncbi:MAG TPA: SulP family inorganic anion transporter [Candidatus Krumholzibacteria bacterium]|nr:SulP family inorganic anion transporter [Candidatus Krumholzibacteria bacterium]
MSETRIEPKLLTVFREGYTRRLFAHDLGAGFVVGILALPLALAFAIASGVKPEQGLFTAIVGGFIISVLGGSRVQIGGPTGAFVVIVYGVVTKYGYDGLAAATLIAGVLLVVMGLARLGTVIKFIPYPVTVGFTSGIALIIFSSQLRDFFGFRMSDVPAEFVHKWGAYAAASETFNPAAVGVAVATMLIVLLWPRVTARVPSPVVAILATTAAVQLLNIPVETIGGRFGDVPTRLPVPRLPDVDLAIIRSVFPAAISIALLAGIESLLSAVVADGMTGRRHRSNTELLAQGVANIASPIFGGIPCTGAIARTATNVRSGGRTPVAGIIHAAVLLLIMMAFGKWATLVPMATLAGFLVVISYRMSEWRLMVKIFRSTKSDTLVMIITFLLTVLVDLTVAIQMGVVLASFLFMRRMADVTQTAYVQDIISEEEGDDDDSVRERRIPDGVAVFEIYGPFFFGAADKFKSTLNRVDKKPRVLILRMRHVLTIDATGLHALEDVFDKTKRDGTTLILSGVHVRVLSVIRQSGLAEHIGSDNIRSGFEDALARAEQLVARGVPS